MLENTLPQQWIAEMDDAQPWEKKIDGWWLDTSSPETMHMARAMTKIGARLITLTAQPCQPGEYQIAYHWDYQGEVFTWLTCTRGAEVASISAVCPGADWAEREIRDYFAVNFLGRDAQPPLMLRPEDRPGVFAPQERKTL